MLRRKAPLRDSSDSTEVLQERQKIYSFGQLNCACPQRLLSSTKHWLRKTCPRSIQIIAFLLCFIVLFSWIKVRIFSNASMAFFEMNASSGIEEFAYNPLLREICKGDITITKSSHHSYFEAMKIYGVRKWTTLMKDYYRKDLRQLGIRMRALKDLLYDFEKIQELPEKERNLICKTHGRELASVVNILESSVKLLARWISPYSLLTLWRMNKKKDTLPPKGIVMLGGKKQLPFIQTLIFSIRVVHNSSLPIELFYLGDDDLDKASREILSTSYPDIFTRNIYDFVSSYYLDFTGFDSKPFVVLFANAVEVLYIDVDAVLLQIPEVFFNFSQYQETGALFFHDRMWGRDGGPKKLLNLVTDHTYPSTTDRLYSIQFNGDHEQESGVLVVDKSRNFLGLFGACKLMDTAEKEIMQIYSYGDKESFWLGFEMMQLPYSWGDFYPGSIGDATKNENDQGSVTCGRLLHFDSDGLPLWWNGGYKMVEKHFDDYINLPFLDPLYFDDGGRRDSLEKSVNWKAKGFERYCVSSSIRGSRALPDDLREVALRIIKYFSNLQPAQVASPSDKTGG